MKNHHRLCLVFIFTLLHFLSFGQNQMQQEYEAIINSELITSEKVIEVESLLKNKGTYQAEDVAAVLYQFSKWCFIRLDDHKRGQKYARQEYELRSQQLDDDDLLKRNLYNLGYMFHHTGYPNYDRSLRYFNELISLSDNSERRLGNAYREVGDIYDELGDFRNALIHYEKSGRIFKFQKNKRLLLTTYINISGMYVDTNDSVFVKPFFKNLEQIKKLEVEVELSRKQRAILLLNTAAMLRTTSDYPRGTETAREALLLFTEDKDSLNIFKTLGLLGTIEKREGNYTKAEALFTSSKDFFEDDVLKESSIYNNLGDIFLARNEHKKAMELYQKAIFTLTANHGQGKEYTLEELVREGVLPYKKHVLDYLIDQANGWFMNYKASAKREHLLEAEKSSVLADKLIDQLYFESREELSKLSWRKKGAQLYARAVSICYLLEKPAQAFYYMEKNKGLLLLENITSVKARELGNVPEAVTNRENSLLNQIKQVQLSFTTIDKKMETSQSLDVTKNLLFNLKRDYKLYVDSLKQQFPGYYKYRQELELVNLKEVQDQLQEDESIVEYIFGEEEGYAIFMSKDEVELLRLPSLSLIDNQLSQFKELIRKPFGSREEIQQFKQVATKLHHLVLPFKLYKKLPKGSKIAIVADGGLQYIPFEALLKSDKGELLENYLLHNFTISYKYSLSVESKFETLDTHKNGRYLAFLPSKFMDSYVPDLLGGLQEKQAIDAYFGDKIVEGSNATKASFLKKYDENSIIHVSTHGGVDNGQPWLAFYDEPLFLDELYFLKNQKDLVVLSACKTSVGEIIRGEGLLNLTRGFINSGAKSVVSTLWDINEKSSSEIVSHFYENLHGGESKSSALRNAKLRYLKNYSNTSEASPYYWSSIILTGDDRAVASITHLGWLLGGMALIVVGCILYFVRKRRSTARPN